MNNRIRLRVNIIFLMICATLGLLAIRIAWIQIDGHERYKKRQDRQQHGKETLVAERGKILDSQGRVLALSVPVRSLYAVPGLVLDKDLAAQAVANITGLSESYIRKRLNDNDRQFIWIKRHLSDELATAIEKSKLVGFGFRQEYKRVYPQGRLASHVLGMTDIDQIGLEGIEKQFNDVLTGIDGWRITRKDALRRNYVTDGFKEQAPVRGQDVQLTIDSVIQNIAQDAVAETAKEWKPESISCVVIDPQTGRILAMVNYPDYDPNAPGESPADNRRNRSLTDTFEPGSMNKQFIAAAALQNNVVQPDTEIFCERGSWKYRARRIKDTHRYGKLTVRKIISKSSNIGTTKIGLLLQEYGATQEKNLIRNYLLDLGFGRRSGIQLPAEDPGRVTSAERWSYHSDVSNCFGYEIGVTALQITLATSVIASRGNLMQPMIVDQIQSADGTVQSFDPYVVRRVYDVETMNTVSSILAEVVSEGTARRVKSKDYRIAGKTGTSHKVVGGRYVNKYYSSFVGYAPEDQPKITVLVSVNEPHGRSHYGGTVAGPAVKVIIEQSLGYLKTSSREATVSND